MTQILRKLGKNGVSVNAIGYGCMGLSTFYGTVKPDAERLAFLDHIYEAGERHWDTADMYGDSEDLLGKWFKNNPAARSEIFLATKFAGMTVNNSPDYIRSCFSSSLERLGTDYVDIYYCHRVNSQQPIETTVGVMKQFKDEGKVRYLGLSEVSAATLRRACKVVHIDAVQMEFNPFAMEAETEGIIAACEELGVALVAYSPLGRGFLTGTIQSPDDFEADDFRRVLPRFSPENFPKNIELVKSLQDIAKTAGVTSSQLVLAWLLRTSENVFVIPGTTKTRNFHENMATADVQLSQDTVGRVRAAINRATVHGQRYPDNMSGALLANTVEIA